jgi:hypothetical protein
MVHSMDQFSPARYTSQLLRLSFHPIKDLERPRRDRRGLRGRLGEFEEEHITLTATLAIRATIGPTKETAMMTPVALNAGDRIFVLDKDHSPT